MPEILNLFNAMITAARIQVIITASAAGLRTGYVLVMNCGSIVGVDKPIETKMPVQIASWLATPAMKLRQEKCSLPAVKDIGSIIPGSILPARTVMNEDRDNTLQAFSVFSGDTGRSLPRMLVTRSPFLRARWKTSEAPARLPAMDTQMIMLAWRAAPVDIWYPAYIIMPCINPKVGMPASFNAWARKQMNRMNMKKAD